MLATFPRSSAALSARSLARPPGRRRCLLASRPPKVARPARCLLPAALLLPRMSHDEGLQRVDAAAVAGLVAARRARCGVLLLGMRPAR